MNTREHPDHQDSQTMLCARRWRVTLTLALTFSLFVLTAGHAQQGVTPQTYTLPSDAAFPEGIAYNAATGDFFVGSTRNGAVYRGNAQNGNSQLEVFLAAGTDDRTAVTGMKVDEQGRLFIAGRNTGRVFVYDTASGELIRRLETFPSGSTLINDVTVTADAAYFTDSFRPVIFRVPLTPDSVGEIEAWLEIEGTSIGYRNGFNLNGIAATEDRRYLLTVQFNTGQLFRIDTGTRKVTRVDLGGRTLTTGDGLVLEGRTLYVVRENPAEIVPVTLSDDLAKGEVAVAFTDPSLDLPTTAAKVGDRLLVVNSQLDGSPPEPPFTISSVPIP